MGGERVRAAEPYGSLSQELRLSLPLYSNPQWWQLCWHPPLMRVPMPNTERNLPRGNPHSISHKTDWFLSQNGLRGRQDGADTQTAPLPEAQLSVLLIDTELQAELESDEDITDQSSPPRDPNKRPASSPLQCPQNKAPVNKKLFISPAHNLPQIDENPTLLDEYPAWQTCFNTWT